MLISQHDSEGVAATQIKVVGGSPQITSISRDFTVSNYFNSYPLEAHQSFFDPISREGSLSSANAGIKVVFRATYPGYGELQLLSKRLGKAHQDGESNLSLFEAL